MMKVVDANMLDMTKGMLVHQVNTSGVMGAGIALQIARKWPDVEQTYRDLVADVNNSELLLGFTQYVPINENLIVVNLFGQHLGVDKRPTRYDATVDGWTNIAKNYQYLRDNVDADIAVYLPYGMGCGLGGGDWKIYSAIVNAIVPDAIACRI